MEDYLKTLLGITPSRSSVNPNVGMFGMSPYEAEQAAYSDDAAFADRLAKASLAEKETMGLGRAGAGLGRMVGGMMGLVDPRVEQAKQQQSIQSQIDHNSVEGLMKGAQLFNAAGNPRMAFMYTQAAQAAKAREQASITSAAEAKRKEYAAMPDLEKYAIAMARRSGLKEGTPEFDEFVSTWMYEQKEKTAKDAKLSSYATQLEEEGILRGTPEFQRRMAIYNAAEITGKTKPVGTSVTNIVGKGDTKYAENRLGDVAKSMTDLSKSAESAYRANIALDRFLEASKGASAGSAQPLISATKNLLASFGYQSKDLQDVTKMEQAIGDILGSKMAELGARGLTDKDMEVLRQALPRINTDRKARENVARIVKQANEFTLNEYQTARDEEVRVYPELSTKMPVPAWFKAYKKQSGSVGAIPSVSAIDAELARRSKK